MLSGIRRNAYPQLKQGTAAALLECRHLPTNARCPAALRSPLDVQALAQRNFRRGLHSSESLCQPGRGRGLWRPVRTSVTRPTSPRRLPGRRCATPSGLSEAALCLFLPAPISWTMVQENPWAPGGCLRSVTTCPSVQGGSQRMVPFGTSAW